MPAIWLVTSQYPAADFICIQVANPSPPDSFSEFLSLPGTPT